MMHLATNELFDVTNRALLAGDFSVAREGLEILSRRPDHVDLFCAADTYTSRLHPLQRQPLADRLSEANRTALRNTA